MGRYVNDQNKVVLFHESGTYASPSGAGFWPSQVIENSIEDAENHLTDRFLGNLSRSYNSSELGPNDVTGTLTYFPQNMQLPFIVTGSVFESGTGTNILHTATQINNDVAQSEFTSGTLCPPRSLTLEDSKQATGTGKNFIRTINGVVPMGFTLTATQGEKVQIEIPYIGQSLTVTSGVTSVVTENLQTPYLWDSATVTVDGVNLLTTKEAVLDVAQNTTGPHYLDGNRGISVPFQGNRDITLSLTIDLDSQDAVQLYEKKQNNTTFNAVFDLNQDIIATGSQHVEFVLSGCRITTMDPPSTNEGTVETTVDILVQDLSATEHVKGQFNPF